MIKPPTPGPEYYRLADGRQLWELEASELVEVCRMHDLHGWDTHCLLSAAEHRFRCGAKEGEAETDKIAEQWWYDQMSINGFLTMCHLDIQARIDAERKAVGR